MRATSKQKATGGRVNTGSVPRYSQDVSSPAERRVLLPSDGSGDEVAK